MNDETIIAVPGIQKTTPRFRRDLWEMAQRHQWDVDGIAITMALESRFNPAATNPRTNATGLIQFMPSTAKGLGTSVAALRSMEDWEQLPFVERYYTGLLGSGVPNPMPQKYDYLLLVYTGKPSLIGKPAETVVSTTGEYADSLGRTTIASVWHHAAAEEARAKGLRIDLDSPAVGRRRPGGALGGLVTLFIPIGAVLLWLTRRM
jgi:hypothetical protein